MTLPDRFEFGAFHLDVGGRALYHAGAFVPVAPKALETLLVLVEAAGHVVSKDDLLQRVWPDAFVEEGSIANNISALRKILNPHFAGDGPIATVARRGYRFTAPVTIKPRIEDTIPASNVGSAPTSDAALSSQPIHGTTSSARPVSTQTRFAVVAVIAATVLAALFWGRSVLESRLFTPVPAIRRSVAVLPMKNLSGQAEHAWFSTALSETIGAELMAGPQFRLVSGDNVLRMQRELDLPSVVGLTRKQLDAVGRDLGCDLILSGSFLTAGGKIRLDVRLEDVGSGEPVAVTSGTADERDLLALVQRAGADLRSKIGVAQPGAAQADSVRASFASNPETIRLYFEGSMRSGCATARGRPIV